MRLDKKCLNLRPGGVEYHMTGPEGDQPHAFWNADQVQPQHLLVFSNGFANQDSTPNTELPVTTMRVSVDR